MKPCSDMHDQLVDLHYGMLAPEEEKAIRDHVVSCAVCAAEVETIRTLMGALRADEAFPRESEVNWEAFARVTVARAVAPGTAATISPVSDDMPLWHRLFQSLTRPMTVSFSPAMAAISVALLIGAGVTVYQFMPSGTPGQAIDNHQHTPVAVILVPEESLNQLTVNLARNNTARYLDETRAVLLTLMEVPIGCDDETVDITEERVRAARLLRRQRLVATELGRLPLARAKDVTSDLQQILLEISSLADCTRDEEIQTLRDVVEKRQILMRMELLSEELKRRGASHV